MKHTFTFFLAILFTLAVSGQVNLPEAGEEKGIVQELSIYPNPTTTGNFSIKFETQDTKEITVKLYNLIGKEVLIQKIQVFQGLNEQDFNLNGQPKGVYILEISNEEKKEIRRISFV